MQLAFIPNTSQGRWGSQVRAERGRLCSPQAGSGSGSGPALPTALSAGSDPGLGLTVKVERASALVWLTEAAHPQCCTRQPTADVDAERGEGSVRTTWAFCHKANLGTWQQQKRAHKLFLLFLQA